MDLGQRLPRDVFPGVWESIEVLVLEGRAVLPRIVLDELERHDPYCHSWAKALQGFVVDADEQEVAVVAAIAIAHPGWVQGKKNAADPFLIANAAVHGRIVVTHEKRAGPAALDHNLAIPNVADEHSVECLVLHEIARRENWRFTRSVT